MISEMDLALWCYTLLMAALPPDSSASYKAKHTRLAEQRTPVCVALGSKAARMGADPLQIISVAAHESLFDKTAVSPKQARGIMQMTPIAKTEWCSAYSIRTGKPSRLTRRFATPQEVKRCDVTAAAIRYLIYLDSKNQDLCDTFAKYNAGPRGSCRGLGGSYGKAVVDLMVKAEEEIQDSYRTLSVVSQYDDTEEHCNESAIIPRPEGAATPQPRAKLP